MFIPLNASRAKLILLVLTNLNGTSLYVLILQYAFKNLVSPPQSEITIDCMCKRCKKNVKEKIAILSGNNK